VCVWKRKKKKEEKERKMNGKKDIF
jgi:hypothetical protein